MPGSTAIAVREKGFSLGAFDASYLLRTAARAGVSARRLAASRMCCARSSSAKSSVDLMRQLPDAPRQTMDFMFTQFMLHFQAQGMQRFALGMAPMSGMVQHELAPRWHRFGRCCSTHGESFYNFRGLRSFKDKFHPVWEPRYLAAPRGIAYVCCARRHCRADRRRAARRDRQMSRSVAAPRC